jgi:hypothetical protein
MADNETFSGYVAIVCAAVWIAFPSVKNVTNVHVCGAQQQTQRM